ncbi:MAG: family 10 glycosylhydrolase [Elusimicrobia bacterium]|nr:family 10 glycosylhydrolase [Elusimicrobiota bacterium]
MRWRDSRCCLTGLAALSLAGCASQPAKRALADAPLGTGLAAIAVAPDPPATFNEQNEMRAGWIVGWRQMVSTAAIDDAMDLAQAAGLNTLFVQARVNGDAYYHSDFVPRAETLSGQPDDFDPLAYALRKGHKKGFQVHAWVNLGVVWRSSTTLPVDPRHIFNAHPDWIMRDAAGKPSFPDPKDPQPGYVEENYWINWNHPDAQRHLVQVIAELSRRYAVDGIHYDFARYPAHMGPRTPGAGYDPVSIRRFQEETGRQPAEHTQEWDEWRLKQITAVLGSCREEIKRARPAAAVSAAVLAAWNLGYGRNFTGYRGWLQSNLLDFAVLMSYFKDPTQNWQSVINARETADSRRIVLGLYMPLLSPEAAARQLLFSREQDLKGFSLFSLDHVDLKDPRSYLARLRALALPPASDTRYQEREPLWNRVAIIDPDHRGFSLRFFSRTGKTKLVVYPRGITSLRFAVNDRKFSPILASGTAPIQIDLSPWLNPFAREVAANHDFTLTVSADGPPDSFAEIFTVDYYNAPPR